MPFLSITKDPESLRKELEETKKVLETTKQKLAEYLEVYGPPDAVERSPLTWDQFKHAWTKQGRIATAGLACGLLLILMGHLVLEVQPGKAGLVTLVHVLSTVFRDVGLGVIVSACAVVLYEWGSHVRIALDRANALSSAIHKAADILPRLKEHESLQQSLNETNLVLGQMKGFENTITTLTALMEKIKKAEIKRRVEMVLDELLSDTADERRLRDNIKSIFRQVIRIKDSRNRDKERYIKFLQWYLEKLVASCTNFLSEISEMQVDKLWKLNMKSTREVSSRFLGEQMETMEAGDEFLSVTNLLFWEGSELDYFQQKTENACRERGVKVKRIFNLMNFFDGSDNVDERFQTAKEIVDKHLRFERETTSKDGALYEIRFYGGNEFKKLKETIGHRNIQFQGISMALFMRKHKNSEISILCQAGNGFQTFTTTLSEVDVNSYEETFDEMWKVSRPSTENPFQGESFSYPHE